MDKEAKPVCLAYSSCFPRILALNFHETPHQMMLPKFFFFLFLLLGDIKSKVSYRICAHCRAAQTIQMRTAH